MSNVSQIFGTLRNSEPYIILNSTETEVSGNLSILNNTIIKQNLDVCGNITFNNIDLSSVLSNLIVDLTGGQDASFTNVDISGSLTLNNIDISGKLTQIDASLVDLASNSGGSGGVNNGDDVSFGNIVGTITTAAQPNITSIGTLTSLSLNSMSVSLGEYSGSGDRTVAIGYYTGKNNMGRESIVLGYEAAKNNIGERSVAIGMYSGTEYMGDYSVAVGYSAGYDNMGSNSIAIGYKASANNNNGSNSPRYNNYIVLNAQTNDTPLNPDNNEALFIKPIRNASNNNKLLYNSGTGEITYVDDPVKGNDASFNNVDISGSLILNNIDISGSLTINNLELKNYLLIEKYEIESTTIDYTNFQRLSNSTIVLSNSSWGVYPIKFSGNGNILAIGTPLNDFNNIVHIYQYNDICNNYIPFPNNSNYIISVDNTSTSNRLTSLSNPRFGWDLALSHDGTKLFIGSLGAGIIPYKYDSINSQWIEYGKSPSNNNISLLKLDSTTNDNGVSVSCNADGNIVILGDRTVNNAKVFKLNSTSDVWESMTFDTNDNRIGHVYMVPDGSRFFIGSNPTNGNVQAIKYWDYSSVNNRWEYSNTTFNSYTYEFSSTPDGNTVIGGSEGNTKDVYINKYINNSWNQSIISYPYAAIGEKFGYFVLIDSTGNYAFISTRDGDKIHIYEYNSSSNTWSDISANIIKPTSGDDSFNKFGYGMHYDENNQVLAVGSSDSNRILLYQIPKSSEQSSPFNIINDVSINGNLKAGNASFNNVDISGNLTLTDINLTDINLTGATFTGDVSINANLNFDRGSNDTTKIKFTSSTETDNIRKQTPIIYVGDIETTGGGVGGRMGFDFKFRDGGENNQLYTLFRTYEGGTTGNGQFQVFGSTYSANGWSTSDDRFKHGEYNIDNGLETIRQLVPQTYKKTIKMLDEQNDGTNIGEEGQDWHWESGLIAQEVEQIPTLSKYVKELDDAKYVSYNNIHVHTISAVKELDTIVQQQAQLISSLDTIVKQQGQLISSLEERLLSLESK